MDTILGAINFGMAIFWSVVIWGLGSAAIIFYYVKTGGSHQFYSSFPVFSGPIILTFALVIAWVGAIPLMNHFADLEQYGSLVGASREVFADQYRPFYGRGGFQFVIFLLIVLVGGAVAYYRRENRYY